MTDPEIDSPYGSISASAQYTDLSSASAFCTVNGHAFQLADYGSARLFCPRCGDVIRLDDEDDETEESAP